MVTMPISMMTPMRDIMPSSLLKRSRPRKAPLIDNGRLNMMVSGWRNELNCSARMKKIRMTPIMIACPKPLKASFCCSAWPPISRESEGGSWTLGRTSLVM
ncbi:hypothetical protein D3C87_1517900 [compost metagenome]